MPQLLITSAINNDVYSYTITVQPDTLSQSDQQLIAKYGEPLIDVGGTFGTSPNVYTLPDSYIKVISGLPYTQSFDSTSPPFNTNTLIKTAAWLAAFESNYSAAFTTLRAEDDTFTNQVLFNV